MHHLRWLAGSRYESGCYEVWLDDCTPLVREMFSRMARTVDGYAGVVYVESADWPTADETARAAPEM